MTSGGLGHCPGRRHSINTGVAIALIAVVLVGCGPPGSGGPIASPTYIPQPTPDGTMAAVIRGEGTPVVYLPPLDVKGSPTAAPAAGRPGASTTTSRPATKPVAPPPAAKPARAAAPPPPPKPAPTVAAARPAPTATRSTTTSGSGAAPAIINPNTALPGGAGRPGSSPGR